MKSHIQVSSPDLRLKKEDESIKEFTLDKIKELEELFENKSDVISSLILEPLVQCASGMGIYNKLYLKEARRLCNEYNIHLIADFLLCQYSMNTPIINKRKGKDQRA